MARPVALGEPGPNFENLPSTDGNSYSLSSFRDKQILALIFLGNGCPTCKAAEERLISIQNDYREKGVQLVLLNPNNPSISPPDTMNEMGKRADEIGYVFPYLKDNGAMVAREIGAVTTPHAFLLDRERRLRYKGRIDNARQKSMVTVQDLRNALDEILSGETVTVPETMSFGCSIVW